MSRLSCDRIGCLTESCGSRIVHRLNSPPTLFPSLTIQEPLGLLRVLRAKSVF